MLMNRKRIHIAVLATVLTAASTLLAPLAHAQEYPNKSVRLINPFPPGTSTSLMSRVFAQKFQEQTGQSVVVEYKPGAGSNLGSDMVAKAAPDGYTLLLGTNSMAINPSLYRNMPFDPLRDLATIAILASTPNVLAVNATLPVNNVRELIDYASKNPGKLNYGSAGNGATNHLGMELFKSMAKVNLVHIPFKGGAEALTAIIANETQVMFSPPSTVGQHARSGKLRIIGVGGDKRVDGIDAAPVSDTLPGFDSGVWLALFAPAGTPPAIIARLNKEANLAIRDKQIVDMLIGGGLTPVGGSAADMRSVLERDTKRYAEVIRASGARVD